MVMCHWIREEGGPQIEEIEVRGVADGGEIAPGSYIFLRSVIG